MKRVTISAVLVLLAVVGLSLSPMAQAKTATAIPALTKSAVFTIGSTTVTVDGQPYTMDVAPASTASMTACLTG